MVEGPRVAQPRQAAPRPDQGLLDGILGEVRVSENEASGGIQARAGPAGKLSKGLSVASPRSLHERVLVHVDLSAVGTAWLIVFDSLRRWRRQKSSHFGRAGRWIVTSNGRSLGFSTKRLTDNGQIRA
jgi:hypothetical protein